MTSYFDEYPGLDSSFTEAIRTAAQTRNVADVIVREAHMLNRQIMTTVFCRVQGKLAVSGEHLAEFISPKLYNATWLISQACYDLMLAVGDTSPWYRPLNMYYQVLFPVVMECRGKKVGELSPAAKTEEDSEINSVQEFIQEFITKAIADDASGADRSVMNFNVAAELVKQHQADARKAIIALWQNSLQQEGKARNMDKMLACFIGSAYLIVYHEDEKLCNFMTDQTFCPGLIKEVLELIKSMKS